MIGSIVQAPRFPFFHSQFQIFPEQVRLSGPCPDAWPEMEDDSLAVFRGSVLVEDFVLNWGGLWNAGTSQSSMCFAWIRSTLIDDFSFGPCKYLPAHLRSGSHDSIGACLKIRECSSQ
jgi:hypothetical protein